MKKYNKRILSSGVDTLVLSLDVVWEEPLIFTYLDELKEKAKEYSSEYQGELKHPFSPHPWPFSIKPHGTKGGYAWLLSGSDFSFKIGNWKEPGPRPSVMIEIRSETLWHLGTEEAVKLALGIIEANRGYIVETKLSRVDLCVDVLMQEKRWNAELMDYAVTRATDHAPYYRHKRLTGIRIGKGGISARLYDKPLEIAQQSKKTWMFDIWGIPEVPEGEKVIRIEFQMRREVLKELGLNKPRDLIEKSVNAWAYCTKDWLKFQDRPGFHHTQRSTFEWWEEIQDGFDGVQDAEPLVREKALNVDIKKIVQQVNGGVMSLYVLNQEIRGLKQDTPVIFDECLEAYLKEQNNYSFESSEIEKKLARKRSKYHREKISSEDRAQKIARHFSNR